MRNLRLLKLLTRSVPLESVEKFCVDSLTSTLYFCSDVEIFSINLAGCQECHPIQFRTQRYEGDEVINVQFLSDQLLVSIVMANGDVLFFDPETEEVKVMASISSGIKCAAWSPDLELLALIDGDSCLHLFSRDVDLITKVNVNPIGFGSDEQVVVGWGKKETQFHGSEGKGAAVAKTQDVPIEAVEWDDRKPRISWRGDGQFFALSSFSPDGNRRVVRVWSRECVHSSTMELISNQGQTIAWRPSGNLIASTQHSASTNAVVFFEHNGLRHGEFVLPCRDAQFRVVEMNWNLDSSLLYVWSEDLCGERFSVQLWTMGNYHWYLKWECLFDDRIQWCCWDAEITNCLHLCLTTGVYKQYQWFWDINRPLISEHFYVETLVAVIDGRKLKLTPFKMGIIPPPMSAVEIDFPCAVNEISFAANTSQQRSFLVHLSNGHICIVGEYMATGNEIAFDTSGFRKKWNPQWDIQQFQGLPRSGIYSLQLMSDNLIVAAAYDSSGTYEVISIQLDRDTKASELIDRVVLPLNTNGLIVTKIVPSTVALHTGNGDVVSYSLVDGKFMKNSTSLPVKLPGFCPFFTSIHLGGESSMIVALNERYQLFINGEEVGHNVSSFVVTKGFLLLTTLSHQLFAIPWATINETDMPKLAELQCYSRNVERGSRLVAAMFNDTGVILQMPRGNLEVVHPRQITLTVIRDLLDQLKYKDAVLLMKRHRVDMNLAYDHNPELFLQNFNVFVNDVDDSSLFNLFLSDLKDDDVLASLYSSVLLPKAQLKPSLNTLRGGKVNILCQKVRDCLEASGKTEIHCTTVVTSLARSIPPQVDLALQKIKEWKDAKKLAIAESSLRYLLYMVDVDSLFNTALGTYDFDLVLMVAEKSQKDPKEYLPFLNELQKLPDPYRMFKIDVHLKRFESALNHIVACGDEKMSECVELINHHHLYRQALKLYPQQSESWKRVSADYGEHLESKRHFSEAALMFEQCGQHLRAFGCYQKNLNWRLAFSMASTAGLSHAEVIASAKEMAERLKDRRKFTDAAAVYERYAQDPLAAANTLIEGDMWDAAYELMITQRLDSVRDHFKSALRAKWKSLLSTCDKSRKNFDHHRIRLMAVRESKKKKLHERLELGIDNDVQESEVYSEASSSVSTTSKSSSVSSRVRHAKKAERKKQSLKEGSAYEDLALLTALHELVTHVESIREDIVNLTGHLCRVNLESEGKLLQTNYRELVGLIQGHLKDIWPSTIELHTIPGPVRSNFEITEDSPWTKEDKIMESLLVAPTISAEVDWQLDHLID